jgi:hypothetical protein
VSCARKALSALALAALASALLAAGASAAIAPSPAWSIESLALPTNFKPEDEANPYLYEVPVLDATAAPLGSGVVTITDTLPSGLTVKSLELTVPLAGSSGTINAAALCEQALVGEVTTVSCKVPGKVSGQSVSREAMTLKVQVKTPLSAEGPLTNQAQVNGAGALAATATSHNLASPEVASPGFSAFHTEAINPDGSAATQAASHPYQFTSSFVLNTENAKEVAIPAGGDLKDVRVVLPPGFVGNPTATALCSPQQFTEITQPPSSAPFNACPSGSVVGTVNTKAEKLARLTTPIFAIAPPPGMPAQFGFQVAGLSFYLNTSLGAGPDYPIIAHLENLSEIQRPVAARFTLWGTPADPAHDAQRGAQCLALSGASTGSCPAGQSPKPFLRLPSSCEAPLSTQMLFSTWNDPLSFHAQSATMPAPEGCSALGFAPSVLAQTQTTVADSPAGLHVDVHVPQNEDPELLASPDLRDAQVSFPAGVSVNPSSAVGLQSCSPEEVELNGTQPARCPDASKIGAVEIKTPLLDHPVKGGVYLASQGNNPFNSLLAIYIAVADPQSGVVVKLAGKVSPDPVTGQLSTTFTDNPQFPFEDLVVDLFAGARAPLRTPATCGTYTTTTDLRPWSAPQSGPDATPSDSFPITTAPGGGACAPSQAQLPNQPSFAAGSAAPLAGSYTSFSAQLRREDGSQNISGLNVTLPKGVLARLAGVPYCPPAAIAAAAARSNPGEGALELASPSCPPASQLGSVTVAAGAGATPLEVQGKAYFAGPYKGAPLSLAIITPAVAGPFDLGVVVVRAALRVDPQSAQVTVASDPFPTILQGIPLDLRAVSVNINRNSYTLNPTSCDPTAVSGEAISTTGQVAALSDRFQVGGCGGLGFAPKLSLNLKGPTRRAQHPALKAVLTQPAGQANAARISVTLPHTEFIDQARVSSPCTRPQFNEGKCPAKSVLGRARVFTPLLDKPLEGKIYFRSNGGERELPDLVADLEGQIHVVLVGFVDSVNHKGSEDSRIRTTFAAVPDAPVAKAVIELNGGKNGLLINSANLCAAKNRALVKMDAHNGKSQDFQPVVGDSCKSKGKKGKARR